MNPFLKVATPLAQACARRLMELRQTPLIKQRKPDHSLVTNADIEVDAMIRDTLHKAFPDHAILTEESGLQGSPGASFMWVVDPLDGTKAYAQGIEGFSVMIGLLKDGKPHLGVVADPLEGHLYEAVEGEGTYHVLHDRRERVHVSARKQWGEMPVVTSTGFPASLQASIQKQLTGPWVPSINSIGIKAGLVVRQVADIYINEHMVHVWDTCAPQAIVEQAGGAFTFLDGTPISYPAQNNYRHRKPTLATNGQRHADVIEVLQSIMPRG